MGFFDKSSDSAGALSPLTRDRITAVLDAGGMNYGIDDDGDVGGWWDGHLFFFFLMGQQGEILQLRGRWNREVASDQYDNLVALANRINSERIFPRVTVLRDDEGDVSVFAMHGVDYEKGVTDDQLDLHFSTAIGSSLSAFEFLDEQYPAEAAAAKAKLDAE